MSIDEPIKICKYYLYKITTDAYENLSEQQVRISEGSSKNIPLSPKHKIKRNTFSICISICD